MLPFRLFILQRSSIADPIIRVHFSGCTSRGSAWFHYSLLFDVHEVGSKGKPKYDRVDFSPIRLPFMHQVVSEGGQSYWDDRI
jgi:hypothetical protein